MSPTVAWLDQLVAFDTTSHRSNLPLIDCVRERLVALGVPVALVFDPTGSKAALLASVGPAGEPGLVLSGHSDVVPVEGQAWSGDPFRLHRDGDRLVARGACDMKGFVAAALVALEGCLEKPLRRPVHLALSYDEEVGCKGIEPLLRTLPGLLRAPPIGCVVGEPTGMAVVDGHKGKGAWRCEVIGRGGHSALTHLTANAVIAAARLIAEIGRMQGALAADGPFAEGFEPPHTTANVGRIEGGGQINIVPDRCSFELEFRTVPGSEATSCFAALERFARDEVLADLRRVAPEAQIRFTPTIAYPGLAPADPPDPFVATCAQLSGTARPGRVAYGTEAGHFAAHGIACAICGPGDMIVAHKPDEYVTTQQLDACDRFLERLIDRVCA